MSMSAWTMATLMVTLAMTSTATLMAAAMAMMGAWGLSAVN